MKNKKFTILVSCLVLLGILSMTPAIAQAQAQGGANTDTTQGGQNKITTVKLTNPLKKELGSVGDVVMKFVEIFSYIVIIFAVLMLVWTGLQFILARGNVDRMKELKNQLLWIVVGIAIVIGARVLVTIVINTLEATGTVDKGTIQNINRAL